VIWNIKPDGCVKSPSAALRFTFVVAVYHPSTPLSSCFARLASGAFYAAIAWATFYVIIKSLKKDIFALLQSAVFI
jgi:hypothetical protein